MNVTFYLKESVECYIHWFRQGTVLPRQTALLGYDGGRAPAGTATVISRCPRF